MKDYPIIFSTPMVHALLDGNKTQTRRLITSQWSNLKMHHEMGTLCRLWVRETWQLHEKASDLGKVVYRASERAAYTEFHKMVSVERIGAMRPTPFQERWRPSIHMPRWASRLTLLVTDVRVQRLQDISEADATAEGLTSVTKDGKLFKYGIPDRDGLPGRDNYGWPWDKWQRDPREAYFDLWASLHGRQSVFDNPEVVAIGFDVRRCNIDQMEKGV